MKNRTEIVAAALIALLAPSWMPAWGAAEPDEADYFAVFLEGKKVGYAVQKRVVAEGRVTTSERVRISINRVGVPVTLEMTETAVETPDGKPVAFEAVQDFSMMTVTLQGQVRPDGTMEVVTRSMGAEQKTKAPWPAGAIMAEGLRLLSLQKGLAEGTQFKATVFTPSLMQAVEAEVIVGSKRDVDLLGTPASLTEVKTSLNVPGSGRLVTTSYVDDSLHAAKSVVPMAGMQFEMVRCSEALATSPFDPVEFITKMLIPSPVPLEDLSRVSAVTYRLRAREAGDALAIPQGDTQVVRRLEDGALEVTVKPVRPDRGGAFPYKGDDPELLAALKPNAFLQSEDKTLVQLARQAVGDANDAAEAVRRIEAFVAGHVKNKDLTVGYASAAEVASTRQGDCTEHALLTAALCRAAGIPARVVTGLAYVPEFAGVRNCFGGHAWTAAYVGGQWMGLDAMFRGTGRGGFDAGHIALAVGDGEPGDFFGLAATLGRFTIETATAIAP
ncbi:MAG: transglutaminase domain-containing protein [Phycisphaerae bacterium]|nr:transglutaminase domain-containing protein [Phycisphaerae bacterium]